VPSKIIEHLSTEDLVVRENEKVTLVCNVTGVPMPEVTWYRHVTDKKGVQKQSEFCLNTERKQPHWCFILAIVFDTERKQPHWCFILAIVFDT
jgi:hypothetical protein